jgi:SNF2 family DNA or RNA helicase
VKKLGTKAGAVFGDLRNASQHPLLLLNWYSHEATLRRIARALYDCGSYGFEANNTPERVFKELLKLSDLELFVKCGSEGWKNGLEGLLAARQGSSSSSSTSASASSASASASASARSTGGDCFPPYASLPPPSSKAAIVPIDLSSRPELKDRTLLRAAALALPPWAWASSAKLDALRTLLPSLLQAGHKVLIFSQLMDLLTVLQVCLASWGIRALRLDGSTPVDERQALLDTFNRTPGLGVFLLSTKAGGLGLNLTAADTVIIHDSDWNPHADAQAVDRAHRMGQTRPVTVYRLLSAGTMDEHIARMAAQKLELDRALKGKAGSGGAFLSPDKAAGAAKNKKVQEEVLAALLRSGVE